MDDDEEVPNDLEEERHWNETTDDTTQDDDAETLGIEANSIAATFIATLVTNDEYTDKLKFVECAQTYRLSDGSYPLLPNAGGPYGVLCCVPMPSNDPCSSSRSASFISGQATT